VEFLQPSVTGCGNVTVTFVDNIVVNDDGSTTYTRTWTATDSCFNATNPSSAATCVQVITVQACDPFSCNYHNAKRVNQSKQANKPKNPNSIPHKPVVNKNKTQTPAQRKVVPKPPVNPVVRPPTPLQDKTGIAHPPRPHKVPAQQAPIQIKGGVKVVRLDDSPKRKMIINKKK
jgi:hypothetical protein